MKKRVFRYIKHIGLTFLSLLIIGFIILINIGGSVHYSDNPLMKNLDKEGPYVFHENDSTLSVHYIRGNKEDGFYTESQNYPIDSLIKATCYFPLDSSSFNFNIVADFKSPEVIYQDDAPVLAISDIESGFKTFRDYLIQNKVIDKNLNWIFGKGHLVLVGDFVDRGYSTMQVLWFIYKLEQSAKKNGGTVHFIIGNHEIKNMQGKYESASPKYYGTATILGKQHHELYNKKSFIGKWMSSKNTIELINGTLFAHGGIHPEVAEMKLNIKQINESIRNNYYKSYYPKTEKTEEQFLISNRTGIAWYRGYFKEDLEQSQIDNILTKFDAKSIVVGHTLQSKVNRIFEGKVIAIDVKHPKDYQNNFPFQNSEGLLIKGGKYFRVLHTGAKQEL